MVQMPAPMLKEAKSSTRICVKLLVADAQRNTPDRSDGVGDIDDAFFVVAFAYQLRL